MNVLPIYLATIADAGDGVYSMSLVDYPATEVNWVTFAEDKQIQHFSIQDEEQHLLCGAVMLADTNIYRRDGDFEYYIRYDKETVKLMAEKMLSDQTFNNIDLMHDGKIIPKGSVNLVELFIKDETKGLNPTYLDNIPDGSLLCTYKVNDDELWELCKDGTFQGFSLSGYFTPKLIHKEQKNNKTTMNKIKELLAKMLLSMAAVATDKGVLVWSGDEDLKKGDIVTLEDGSQPENGDYKTEDGKVITIEDGKVAKIEDAEAEVESDEPKSEEFSKKEAFDKIKAQFEATYQEVQNNIYSALSEAGIYGYIVENTNEYAVVSVWGADDLEHLYRYSITVAEDGFVTLGEMVEVEVKYEPKADEPAEEPKAEEFAEEEPAEEEKPAEEPEPEFDVKAEIEALKAEIEEIKKALADIVEKPAEEPIVEQFEKVTIDETTISPKLAKAIKRVSTLRKG